MFSCEWHEKILILSFFLVFLCCFSGVGLADNHLIPQDSSEAFSEERQQVDAEAFSDKVIGSTFKVLAKAFIKTVNMEKFKRVNIIKLEKMSDEKFAKNNLKVYEFTKDLPLEIKNRYSVSDHMTRQQAIDNISSLDKKDVYELIDHMSNGLIAEKFRQYVRNSRGKVADNDVVSYIKVMWTDFIGKATGDSTKKKA